MAADDEIWDLENLRRARRLGDWVFEQFRPYVRGRVAEIGAGIGTYSERIRAAGVEDLLLVEPDPACSARLERDFAGRATVAAEELPAAPSLRPEDRDLVVALNVVEHIPDDYGAVAAMARALRPGGVLTLLVPAHPRLYGKLDVKYEHARRYTKERLRDVVERAGLDVLDLYRFNALGILGWVVKNRTGDPRLDPRSLAAYERILPAYRFLVEDRVRPPVGLSLIVHARRGA
ncbi:MAG: class I SAM-dependent methyltransferase [Actinomycetota bacterium]|nr:class I SAM-dependent methyltransferase [Actinomycetota bacterium]MDQ5807824.1 class I SAM-dependent methyltransferase [Actinomycetota bacterium]